MDRWGTQGQGEMTVDLYARTKGEGPWLVMLHGLFGSGDNLGGLARLLEANYRILLLDLRNHGRSAHAPEMTYGDMAQDVFKAMDQHDIDKAIVFGHSMGGKVAMQMALATPERVTALIVGDIAPVRYGNHHDRILQGLRTVEKATPQSRSGAQEILADYVDEPDVLNFLMTNWRRDEQGKWRWRINLSAIVARYADIADGSSGGPYEGPVLFLRGEHSDYVQGEHRDKILALFPSATVKTIGGTGHWLHAEKPDMVARSILRFLEQAELS